MIRPFIDEIIGVEIQQKLLEEILTPALEFEAENNHREAISMYAKFV